MRICVIGNFSDGRCGIKNFCEQTTTALRHAGHEVTAWDGTYSSVYARQQANLPHGAFFPADLAAYDVVHVIWHAITLNHYAGANWGDVVAIPRLVRSFWDCGPSDAYCPFDSWFPVKWMLYQDHREGYHILDYPVPDWVDDLPPADLPFTVGASSVRGDGVQWLREICAREGWATNLPTPGVWLTIEEEIRRLATSTINVCWYHSNAIWSDRASAPSMLIAAKRPILINHDKLLAHLHTAPDLYHGDDLDVALQEIHREWEQGPLFRPYASFERMRWSAVIPQFVSVWEGAR